MSKTVIDGLTNDDFFVSLGRFRNIAEGDKNEFISEDSVLFVVDETAKGTQGIRRQRISDKTNVSIKTNMKMIKIYDDLNRVLSGRIDLNKLIDNVAMSFQQHILNDIYSVFSNATSVDLGGNEYFPTAGTFDKDALIDVISHVESAANKTATIVGTKKACMKLANYIDASDAKNQLHNAGCCGKFYGTPVFAIPQRHKMGTTEFALDDNFTNNYRW